MEATTFNNSGLVTVSDIVKPDQYIGGTVLITVNPDGTFGAVFKAVSLDHAPDPAIQAELAPLLIQAWKTANNPGFEV